ncbi:DNA-directed RNA polymerase I subunit RPA34 [Lissotriton helveticus]
MLQGEIGAVLPLKGSVDSEQGNARMFACPPDFILCPFTSAPSFTKDKVNSSNTELWLIKAPLDFKPASFIRKNIPLIGFKSVKIKNDGKKRLYNIFSSPQEMCSSHVLVPSEDHNQLLSGPSFRGYINICNSFGDPSSGLHPVPGTPILKIPEGLKQRFMPFGATTATRTGRLREDDAQVTHCEPMWMDGVKRKKKKKMLGKVEAVLDQLLCVRQEEMDREGACGNSPEMDQDSRGSCLAAKGLSITDNTIKKRKKKKRDKEHADVSVTALEVKDTLRDEGFLSVIKEEAITEPSDGISDETFRIQHSKKKKKHQSQEILEERSPPHSC